MSRFRIAYALSAVFIASFFIRCVFVGDVFLDNHVIPFGNDSAYHLYRIEYAVAHGWPPRFDPYLNAPFGASIIYPDGFDAALASLSSLIFGRDASRFQVQVTSMLTVPLLGSLAVLVAFLLARSIFSTPVGLLAACIAAVIPASVTPAILGRVDHHLLELAIPPLIVFLLFSAATRDSPPRARGAVAGMLLALLGYTIPAAIMHLGVIAFTIAVGGLYAAWRKESEKASRLFGISAGSFLVGFVLSLPDALTRSGYAFYQPSRLFTVALAGIGVASIVFSIAARRGPRALLCSILGAMGLAGLSLALFAEGALGFVGREGAISLVRESMGAWMLIGHPVERYALPVLVLTPPACIYVAYRSDRFDGWGVTAMGALGSVLMLLQMRFGVILAIPASVILAKLCYDLFRGEGWYRRGIASFILAVLVFSGAGYLSTAQLSNEKIRSLADASDWLTENTPHPGDRGPSSRASYSIVTNTTGGSMLAYLSSRPFLSGAFYHGDYLEGFNDAIRILFRQRQPRELLEKRKVKYFVLVGQRSTLEREYRRIFLKEERGISVPSVYSHLYDYDGKGLTRRSGAGTILFAAAKGLRLVYESPLKLVRGGRRFPAVKIFERVRGSEVKGVCSKGPVILLMNQKTVQRRTWQYVDFSGCRGGSYAFRVPYSGKAIVKRPLLGDEEIAVSQPRPILE